MHRKTKGVVLLLMMAWLHLAYAASNTCPSVLILFSGSGMIQYAQDLLGELLSEGGAHLVYAEEAQKVIEQFVVQFHEVITNTRSGKMRFSYSLQGSGFSEKQLAQSYAEIVTTAEKLVAGRAKAEYSSATLSSRDYAEFQRQTGYVDIDYGEETEYQDWYNQLMTNQEQRMFWDTIRKWNADIIVFGVLDVIPIGAYGGIHSCRAVVSIRVIDTRSRGEVPRVLKSFAVVTNGVDLSWEAAGQRVTRAAIERVASALSNVIPCYVYRPPLHFEAPMGAVGFAVLDVQADWAYHEIAESVRTFIEAALAKHKEIALCTRKNLDALFSEQRLSLSGLIENPVEVGRLAGVRYIFVGQITECDYQDQHYYIDFPILRYLKLIVRNMRVGLSLSLLDVQTGRILWSAEKARSDVGFSVLFFEFNMSLLEQFRRLANELVSEFCKSYLKP